MKKTGIACFTKRGAALANKITEGLAPEYEIIRYEKNLKEWCARCFSETDGLIFIGAAGIAVRTIAPFLKGKTEDPAVVVCDEDGNYVISLLSGHIGGANEFAKTLAALTGAEAVITTASDVRGKIAVDVFAQKNHLFIESMKAAKQIEAAILREDPVDFYCSGEVEGTIPPELHPISDPAKAGRYLVLVSEFCWNEGVKEENPEKNRKTDENRRADENRKGDQVVLRLIPGSITVGIGCRKGKDAASIEALVRNVLAEEGIRPEALYGAASIDLKKEEEGILAVCGHFGIPFYTYTAEQLDAVPGSFEGSEFVRKTTGTDNVCERSALALAGQGGKIIRKKHAENGVTVALAVRDWRIRFEE